MTLLRAIWSFMLLAAAFALPAQGLAQGRSERVLSGNWQSAVYFDDVADASQNPVPQDAHLPSFDDGDWARVDVPHNWQGYAYNRQVRNGTRHGTAWFRRHLELAAPRGGERVVLQFEGAGPYATVWLNGKEVGRHGGGLVSFFIDITDAVREGDNLLAVRLDNPDGITDLPWAPGDDQPQSGFSEGSQPFGIYRPVHVIRHSSLHIAPYGIYAWGTKATIDEQRATLKTRVEIANDGDAARQFSVVTRMRLPDGAAVAEVTSTQTLAAGQASTVEQTLPAIENPHLWSPDKPFLYTLETELIADGKSVDRQATPYGIRYVELAESEKGERRLLVNGKPVFLRGVAEYEHLLGNSFAFSPTQVDARVAQVEAAGFNAFRDAHYPHNLRYGEAIAKRGLMWWPQFSAHNWFDNAAYRRNFLALLEQWVRERRNNPAVFLWGLQNESQIPGEFAQEAVALIRQLDPTASIQRLVVTCNGGTGTDWNVPQNWSGTYGGDPDNYGNELVEQGMVGEYGAWRSLGRHAEPGAEDDVWTEGTMARLEQKKARLADGVADRAVGHFQWILSTHENPGRPMRGDGTQIFDGIRPLDHVGPANNKGLMTLWGEPLDVYYMYRARQVPASREPMAYIVSHTWPDRWTAPGRKSGIEVYSNCDAVELFNDHDQKVPLGRREAGPEQRFIWNDVPIRYDTLRARCIVDGIARASDEIKLQYLPPAPGNTDKPDAPAGDAAMKDRGVLYRVNAGGKSFADAAGNRWLGDRHFVEGADWGWTSWADDWPDIEPALGSRRISYDDVAAASSDLQPLFRSYRYGRDKLQYRFAVPDGTYRVTLYFAEPWYGRAGIDAAGWRVFDVAINGATRESDLDIFSQVGFNHALRRDFFASADAGWLVISFPKVTAGQAVLSGIEIAQLNDEEAKAPVQDDGTDLLGEMKGAKARRYLDDGDDVFASAGEQWAGLPFELLDADFVQPEVKRDWQATVREESIAHLALPAGKAVPQGWESTELTARSVAMSGGRAKMKDWVFVSRRLPKGAMLRGKAGTAAILQRALPSPYAPGNFTFEVKEGLKEAEAAKLENASVEVTVQGYGGQGYVAMGSGPSSIAWQAKTGAAGRLSMQLRYALSNEEPARDGTISLMDSSGIVVTSIPVSLTPGNGWITVDATTADFINAGTFELKLSVEDGEGVLIDSISLN